MRTHESSLDTPLCVYNIMPLFPRPFFSDVDLTHSWTSACRRIPLSKPPVNNVMTHLPPSTKKERKKKNSCSSKRIFPGIFQGTWVALLFCFFNSEVLSLFKKKYRQYMLTKRGADPALSVSHIWPLPSSIFPDRSTRVHASLLHM